MQPNLARRACAALLTCAVASTWSAPQASATDDAAPPRPTVGEGGAVVVTGHDATAIEGRYLVVLRKGSAIGARQAAASAVEQRGGQVLHEYSHALTGFAARLTPEALDHVRHRADVALVEPDRRVRIDEGPPFAAAAAPVGTADTQSPATWGIDRVDQRRLPLSNSYTYNTTAEGVTAYVIDTGVYFGHQEFGGRAISGFDAIDGGTADDCHGHGTHVAGTIAGTTYGLAKKATVVGVRVLSCAGSGSTSGVIAGIDWVTGHHQAGQPAVANMSLGGGASQALDDAVAGSIGDGIVYSLAAGNDDGDACGHSPARTPAALTVGATTRTDARSSFSNRGRCVDLFAPGTDVTSAWIGGAGATRTVSGTSMAAPHGAGAAALRLAEDPTATPAEIVDQLTADATPGVVTNPGPGSPNLLLHALTEGGGTPPPPPPPDDPPPPPGPPDPPAPGCTDLPHTARGDLPGPGDADFHPGEPGYYRAPAGTHRGCLAGPAGADLDLFLWHWNGTRWEAVAGGQGEGSSETVTYQGPAGYYSWAVISFDGGGEYVVGYEVPVPT